MTPFISPWQKLVTAAAAACICGAAAGQTLSLGGRLYSVTESRANTATGNRQQYTSLGLLRNGNVIVGWEGWQTGASDCYGRIYAASGMPQGGEFLLNVNNTSGWEYGPVFATLPGNGFVAIWGDTSATTEAQTWSGNFQPVGAGFQVVPYDIWPSCATAPSGEYVVILGRSNSMRAKRYSSSGLPIGADFQVNTNSLSWGGDNVSIGAAAYRGDGAVLVVWAQGTDIRGQMFANNWAPIGGEFAINGSTGGVRDMPSVVATSTGQFIVAWHGAGATDPDGIYARRIDAQGMPMGAEWRVNQVTAGSQTMAQAAISPRDELLVAWSSADQSGLGVFARMHDQNGIPVGNEVQVNQWTSGAQSTSWNGGRTGALFAGETLFISWWGSVPGDGDGVGLSVLRPTATYSAFGSGCAGSLGVPSLAAATGSLPVIGTTLTVNLGNLPGGLAFMATGLSNTNALGGSIALPYPMAGYGFPSCDLLVDPLVSQVLLGTGTTASWSLAIPPSPGPRRDALKL